ncbi:MAG: ABC transporter permease [Eubacteriales bacterium]|nr:ABC transporter permease [Eubacteriales bacterium]
MNQRNTVRKGLGHWVLYFTLVILILAAWESADMAGMLHAYTLPPLKTIVATAVEYAQKGALLNNIIVSLIRVLEGFAIALVAGFVLGVLVSVFPRFETFTDLLIQIIRPIPPIAWIPLAILWFGIGQSSKVFIIFLGAFFPIFVNTVDGIKNIDKRYYELVEVYEVPKLEMIRKITIPGALPSITTGIRLGLGNAWVCVVAAEMIGATSGVGFMLADGRSLSRPDVVILGMLIVGIFGKLMDDVLKIIRERIITWN